MVLLVHVFDDTTCLKSHVVLLVHVFADVTCFLLHTGMLYTCSYDYLKDDWNHKSYVLFGFFFCYLIPLIMVFFYYSSIVKAVWAHEHALR